MRQVTIKDIAQIAGVSYSTVSRALSGSSEVSEATRSRILEICNKEGYRVNALARGLISNKTNMIGVIGLSGVVVAKTKEFFTSEEYYLKDINNQKNFLVKK